MSQSSTFTILSNGAPLVEVTGDGPFTDPAGGLAVPNGVPTIGTVDLLNQPLRKWRVNAEPTTTATVSVPNTPDDLGAFLQVYRCVADIFFLPSRLRSLVLGLLKRREPVGAFVVAAAATSEYPSTCKWQLVNTAPDAITARGGDVVAVAFVTP